MASAPSKTVTNTTITKGKKVSVSKTTTGSKTTVTKTTTIGTPVKAKAPAKTTKTPAKTSTPVKAAGQVVAATRWIVGPNDDGWTMCGATAIANALLAATGVRATNADIEALYRDAGGYRDSGAPLDMFLAAAARSGLAGERVASFGRAPADGARLVELSVPAYADESPVPVAHVGHAAAVTPAGLAIIWGTETPLADVASMINDAWSLTWHGEVSS